jgi:hypothetical protein
VRVSKLETWAGPGQAGALATGLRAVRTDVAVIRRVQGQHTAMLATLSRDVAVLKADVAGLKSDMADVKAALAEVLRRLPPAAV